MALFPQRFHRYRSKAALRSLFADTHLQPQDFIAPLFLQEEPGKTAIPSLPGHYRLGPDCVELAIKSLLDAGISTMILFPIVPAEKKTSCCRYAFDDNNLIARSLRVFRQKFPKAVFIADLALDPFHPQGHDGLLNHAGHIDNDRTCDILANQALCYALAGADIVAPSDMMDGRVSVIRQALEKRGLHHTLILSYSAKYASCLYGPFRDAVDSARYLAGADKKTYQIDPASLFQAQLEVQQDSAESADILMIKPGLTYLDIIARTAANSTIPIWSYHVSGECAMIHAGIKAGLFNLEDILFEQLIAQKRAGAQKIVTYFATQAAEIFSH